jgi:hypothetical protein
MSPGDRPGRTVDRHPEEDAMTAATAELAALDVLIGEWTVHVDAFDLPPGRVRYEWALGGRYVVQHSEVADPVPNSMAVLAPAGGPGEFTQHYFDSRGVTRTYRMTLRDGEWTLTRTTPDFSPLDFAQRFVGTFSADGDTIEGHWDQSQDGGATWELDFALTYRRVH